MRMERGCSCCQPCSGHSSRSGKCFAPGTGFGTSVVPRFRHAGKFGNFSGKRKRLHPFATAAIGDIVPEFSRALARNDGRRAARASSDAVDERAALKVIGSRERPFLLSWLGGRTIGSTSDSGSDYPGSSPGLPANFFPPIAAITAKNRTPFLVICAVVASRSN